MAIDTLAAALGSNGDEDHAETMNPVLANCHRIRRATGVCLLLVHHPGKDARRGPRGFSGTRAALSTLIEIEGERGKPKRVIVRKQRDLDFGPDLFFKLQPVTLGVDRRGKAITSCVVAPLLLSDEHEAAERVAKLAKLSPQHRLIVDGLYEALDRFGRNPPQGKPAARVVHWRSWLSVLEERLPDMTEKTRLKALERARHVLLESGLVGAEGDEVWKI